MLSGSIRPNVDASVYAKIGGAMPESCRVILDSSGAPLRHGLDSPMFLIKPNLPELEQLAGRPI